MNNSLHLSDMPILSLDEETPDSEPLREREAKLVRVIEALAGILQSNEWRTLKKELFDEALVTIERQITAESSKEEVNVRELYRLQGERKWARNYSDLSLLMEQYRIELVFIKKQLNPPAERV